MSSGGGACQLTDEPSRDARIVSRCYDQSDGLANSWIRNVYQTSDGKFWFSTVAGLTASIHELGRSSFYTYNEDQGLCTGGAFSVREDREGNIWVATSCGIKRITRRGFVRFNEGDGLASLFVTGIFTSKLGELFVVTKEQTKDDKTSRGTHSINRFVDNRFDFVTPSLPPEVGPGWGGGQILVKDSSGAWWLPGDKQAVYRFARADNFPRLTTAKPQPIPIPDQEGFRIYEDLRGATWISTVYNGHLLKWEPDTQTLRDFKDEIGGKGFATCFAEDRSGNLWIGFDYGDSKLVCYRDGKFKIILTDDTRVGGGFTSLYFDHNGRLWLTSKVNGVGRVDNPGADQLQITWYNRKKGLATDGTGSVVEDKFGRIYVGHGRGVDRLDPATGQIKHYTTADGLPRGAIEFATIDHDGALWFGSHGGGVARLIPEADKPREAPMILLTGLRIGGQKQNVSDLGEARFADLTLASSQNQVSIDFLGLGASLGEELLYRFKMEGTAGDWSEPTTQRTVDFPILSPGTYRLLVKAVTADGTESAVPAAFRFTILPPIWQRWWFLLIWATLVTLGLFSLYRYRLNHLLALERIRTRIASDLHDDIGASLSRIAIMSEVAKRHVPNGDGESLSLMNSIADSARELTASMRDIVWAIDPRRDDLASVVSRIRHFASDVFEAKGIKWDFQTPANLEKLPLGPDQRRHLLLFFKEAITNVARHSECNSARLAIAVEGNNVLGEVHDDGKGISEDPAGSNGRGGHGFDSMKRRISQLAGMLQIDSAPGEGAHLKITIPLKR